MSDDDSYRVLSRKELARELRKQAYQKAKERRAKDPRVLAMKEAARQQRREVYQRVKAQRKEAAARAKTDREQKRVEERAAADEELMKLLRFATKGSTAAN